MKIDGLLREIRKNTGSTSFNESKFGKIDSYIDTGILALNRIISGDIYLGIPSGKVIMINGESQTGKSVLCAQIASNALKQGYDHIFYFDSEGGALKAFFDSFGCDTSKIEQVLLESVEDATVQIISTLKSIQEFKSTEEGSKGKFLMILDSLGALVTTKLYTDIEKGKQVGDMGLRAKLCLDPETEVLMSDRTYKKIKDIKSGDLVVTHLSKAKAVKDVWFTKKTRIYKFNVNGKELRMSENHKMLVNRNGDFMYVQAKDILKSDKFVKLNS